ncbi:MAG: lysophospholipase [Eggerthellaceae bacterium]|nr:lysophospholipase [Eggerthellaceae bacterium]
MSDIITIPLDFTSHDGKTTINAKLWTSAKFGTSEQPGDETPKAIVQIVHGMAEYIDRYDDLAEYLVGRGFVVCAEDHIGHGKSVSDPSEYGHMPAHGGKDILIGDVHTLYRMVRELFADVPYVLYGHSMGSFITRAYIARYGNDLAAAVLSSTGNVPAHLSKFGRTLARTMAATRGETYRSELIDSMGAGAYGKQIENARTDLDWLSTDDAVVDAYIADELCGFMFTVGGYATLLDLTAEVVTPECAARVPKTLPILLVAGDGDPVGDMGKGVDAATQLLRDVGIRQVDEIIYPGMRHEIHNEIGHERVYDDVASWIEGAVRS